MGARDFVQKFLRLFVNEDGNMESINLFAGIADTNKDGYRITILKIVMEIKFLFSPFSSLPRFFISD